MDVYLILTPDIAPEPDPVRENLDKREYFLEWYIREVQQTKQPYYLISGQGAARLQAATEAIMKELAKGLTHNGTYYLTCKDHYQNLRECRQYSSYSVPKSRRRRRSSLSTCTNMMQKNATHTATACQLQSQTAAPAR